MKIVSIIVPVYNVADHIQRCLVSLFEQTYRNIEYIFIDDCTPDNSIDILKSIIEKYPHRKPFIKIIRHEKNKGLAAARRSGILHSTGDYILHVDSDDWLDSKAVEVLIQHAIVSQADIVVFDMQHVFKHHVINEINAIGKSCEDYLRLLLERKSSVNLVTKLYKSSLCKMKDTLPIEGLNYSEDYVTLPRIVYFAKNIVKCNMLLYYYNHLNESSYTNTINRKSIDSLFKTLDILRTFFEYRENKLWNKAILDRMDIINHNIMLGICNKKDIRYVLHHYPVKPLNIAIHLSLKHRIIYMLAISRLIPLIYFYRYVKKHL